jgi:hypothetical protein
MKNQHGLNEGKNHIGKKESLNMSACDVARVVSLGTNNLSIRVCESGEKLCLLILLNGYSLSRSSSNSFTLRNSIYLFYFRIEP